LKRFERLCDDLGLRYLSAGRPGYGESSPRPGRIIADIAQDLAVVLDHHGVDSFISMGCSGGGPNVLACAALLPERCTAAAPVVSPAPIDAEGLDYYAGMGAENVEEWQLAEKGRDAVEPWLQKTVADWGEFNVDTFVESNRGCFPPPDIAVCTTEFGEAVTASFRKATSTGVEGWLEDDLAMVSPWGFDLGEITTPVSVWAGKQDQFVSYRHSVWIAAAIPTADLHVLADHGHLSVQEAMLGEIVGDLLRKSRSAA
jgi:pimeloyl-ACP methyl ester carboxylesterase